MIKISDAKKEIEINLDGMSQNNGVTKTVFRMNMVRPFVISAIFEASNIATEKGKTGVRFGSGSNVADAFRAKNQSVLITLPEEALSWIRSENKRFIAEKKAEASAVVVKSWTWTDDGMPVYYPDGVREEFREDLQKIHEKIEKYGSRIWREMFDASKNITKESDNYRWYSISHEDLIAILTVIEEEQKSKDDAREKKITEQENAAFAIAKDTGEKAQIRRWTVPCEDREEECSTDVVVEYAMPDGTKKTEQYHTW
jgi:hypothetical protein